MTVVQLLTQATGGPCDHAADVALELHTRGADVLVVMRDGPAARRLDAAGVRRSGVGPRSKGDIAGVRDVVSLLRAERPSVLHCQDRRAGLIGRTLAPALRAGRVVYTLHGVPDTLSGRVAGNLQVHPERRRDRLVYLGGERLLGRSGGAVIVPSRALESYAVHDIGLPAEQVHVVPNGVDVARFAPGTRRRRPGSLEVLWLGAVVTVKRVDILLRAVAAVDGVVVRLAGTGELEADHRALVTELGITARVTWLGWVGEPAALLAAADVVALPSAAENLPLVLLQAMASGAACVASAVGGVPEVVTSGVDGQLVPPGDVGALADVLTALRDDAALRDRLGAAARATAVARYDLPLTVDRLLSVYTGAPT